MVAPETRVYTAYMETSTAAHEEAQFLNVDKTRITDANYNHTPTGTVSGANKSAMLNATKDYVGGGGKRIVGPAKAIKVYGGDEVAMEVWTKYAGVASSTTNTSTLIFDAIASAYGLSPSGPTEALYSAMNTFFGGASLISQGPSDRPAAYLEYIYYDKNFQNVPIHGFAQVPSSGSTFQKLSLNFNAPGEGYLFIYVINQSRIDRNVYFPARRCIGPGVAGGDDFKITHASSANVLQADSQFRTRFGNYNPFGLAIQNNNFMEEGILPNRFLYQGKECLPAVVLRRQGKRNWH